MVEAEPVPVEIVEDWRLVMVPMVPIKPVGNPEVDLSGMATGWSSASQIAPPNGRAYEHQRRPTLSDSWFRPRVRPSQVLSVGEGIPDVA